MIKNKTIFIAHNWSDVSVAQQSKALAISFSQSNKVIFLSAKKNGHNSKKINDNLIIFEWPGKRPSGLKDLFFAIKKFKKYKPDIIITNFAANNIMLFVSWLSGTHIRMCYHHTLLEQIITDAGKLSLKNRFLVWRKSLVYKLATHMLPCSTAAKKDLLKNYKVLSSKAFVFSNALTDRRIIKKNNIDQTIGFIGRLDSSKGVDILIQAFAQVSQTIPDVNLIIVGSGKQEAALKSHASHLSSKITFIGSVSYTRIFDFLQNFACLAVPSRTDNLPTVIIEAFSCCTPVVASNAGGIPDMIEDGKNGLLYENGNANELALKLVWLLNNPDECNRISTNARKIFIDKYCTDTLPLRVEHLLKTTQYL